ncbi:MAG: host attachment protein [Hyphomicrobiaceae bacterium]
MKLSSGIWVAVVDGGRGLVLVNEGSALEPRLKVLRRHDGGDNPPSHEQGDDKPGRVFESSGRRRSANEAPELHQRTEDRFVSAFVRQLGEDAAAGRFEKLVLAAPPVALGVLRKHIEAPLAERIVVEIAADYVKMPIDAITKAVAAALDK